MLPSTLPVVLFIVSLCSTVKESSAADKYKSSYGAYHQHRPQSAYATNNGNSQYNGNHPPSKQPDTADPYDLPRAPEFDDEPDLSEEEEAEDSDEYSDSDDLPDTAYPGNRPQYGKPRPTTTTRRPTPATRRPTTAKRTTSSAAADCWWTGCQPNDWAVVGCQQYEKVESARRKCKNGYEYQCCKGTMSQKPSKPSHTLVEECLWSTCLPRNSTPIICPGGFKQEREASCENGGVTIECCGKLPSEEEEDEDIDSLTGESYKNLAKYLLLRDKDFTAEPDSLKCEAVDIGKKHMIRINKNEAIRMCDLCPNFPQKHLLDMYLNRVPSKTENNVDFGNCVGYCYVDKTCVALSYNRDDSVCYMFDSTAGRYEEQEGWNTVLMTQPSSVIQDWTITRHTRFLGYITGSSRESRFLKCLEKCNKIQNCNYVGYSFETRNCSRYETSEDVEYADLVYGHVAGVRNSVALKNPVDRFEQEGDDVKATDNKETSNSGKCSKFKNGTHGAAFNYACQTGGSDLLGCDQRTGCKLCYFPEKTKQYEKLSICEESEYAKTKVAKSAIINRIESCLNEKTCIGVGYNSKSGDVSSINLREYLAKNYNTKFMLKHPTDTERKYLAQYDLVPNAKLKRISTDISSDWKEVTGQTFQQCLRLFEKNKQFTRVSYSMTSRKCKLAKENSGFVRKQSLESLVLFRKPALLSPTLTYLRMPGFAIVSGKPKAASEDCTENCEEECSQQCNKQYGRWCRYISMDVSPDGVICNFYDDKGDFSFRANENSAILNRVALTNFTLESLNKWRNFQGYDLFNCFKEPNKQTQTSLAIYNRTQADEEDTDTEVGKRRRMRRADPWDWLVGAASDAWEGVKQVGQAALDTGKGVVNTVGNLATGNLDAAVESFREIPVVDLALDTGELAGAVFTGDWDKVKDKGLEILESDGFALVTSVAIPGGGGLITQGGKQILKSGLKNTLKKGGKNLIKEGVEHIDDIAKRGSRSIKGKKKPPKKSKKGDKKKERDQKKKEQIDKERGEKCEANRQKRARVRLPKKKPGKSCKEQNTHKCKEPLKVINAIKPTLGDCKNKRLGLKCEYECQPGFGESSLPLNCISANRRAVWKPIPKCVKEECPTGDSPLLVLQTPQKSSIAGSQARDGHITVFVVLFDRKRKLPYWSVALHQSKQFKSHNYNAVKTLGRAHHFTLHPCKQLKGHQAGNSVYKGTNWDRGHLTPANVARWSEKAVRVLSLYINVAPQDPYTNQKPWETLEAHVECFSKRIRTLVATGICSERIGKTGGSSSVDVPSCYWKMACYQDENRNYQVVGFYADNSHVTEEQKGARADQVLTPRSQAELLGMISGGFNNVWARAGPHISSGRSIPITGAVWFPVNVFQCSMALQLSNDEKNAWRSAFEKQAHYLKRGKNVKKPGAESDVDSDSDSDLNRRKRQASEKSPVERGCHGSQFKNYLDQLGFFKAFGEKDVEEEVDNGEEYQDESEEDEEEEDEEEDDEEVNNEDDEGDGSVKVSVHKCGKRIVGYYTSWGNKTIAGLELQRLTHVIYAFLEVKSDGTIIIGSPDRKNSADVNVETQKAKVRLENLMQSAERYPHLKVMFAVGGWENSQYFSSIAESPEKRLVFISSVIKMIDKFSFDGVDIDWEYPVTGGANEGVPADKQNYVKLMKELRAALDNLASEAGRKEKFLISFAGAAGQWTLDPGYDLPGLFKYADFVNIMTYDFFGAWASKWGSYTGPPAPLYFGMPVGFSGKTNVDWTVKYYTCKTKEPHKINMGVPFYGRYWKNVGDSVDGKDEMWRKAEAVNGKFEGGYVPFYELKEDYLSNNAFQKKYHKEAQAPYAWNPRDKIFLGYEDDKSLNEKVKYAVDKNVGGLMIWAVEQDDDDLTLLETVAKAQLCQNTDPKEINHKCSPIDEKRWWTPEDGEDKAGMCGRSAPLYKGYYPVCDPDDPGYSCCGASGYCGKGPDFCDCPTCRNFREDPKTILEEPIKPSIPVTWYFLNDPDGKRGRCGRKIPKIGTTYPTCNPDDPNAYCCSNGGYCNNTVAHCKCDGCIDFKQNPKYQFGPKKWWTLEDGEDLGGRCGPEAPKVDGIYEAECEGTSKFYCCSATGWCGSGPQFCDCEGCKNFKTRA